MRKMLVQACILGALAAWPLYPQVRQATPEDMATATNSREIPSPMLVDIPLGAGTSPNGKPRKAFNDSPAGVTRAYNDATGYVCDKARIGVVLLRLEDRRGKKRITATTALSTEWIRQHVALSVALLSKGKEVRRQQWDDLVLGATKGAAVNAMGNYALGIGTSNSKAPSVEWDLSDSEWSALWEGEAPTLRVILTIAKDEEDG